MRKIVQVSVSRVENSMLCQFNYIIVAICSDGTCWKITDSDLRDENPEWDKLPAIPEFDQPKVQS